MYAKAPVKSENDQHAPNLTGKSLNYLSKETNRNQSVKKKTIRLYNSEVSFPMTSYLALPLRSVVAANVGPWPYRWLLPPAAPAAPARVALRQRQWAAPLGPLPKQSVGAVAERGFWWFGCFEAFEFMNEIGFSLAEECAGKGIRVGSVRKRQMGCFFARQGHPCIGSQKPEGCTIDNVRPFFSEFKDESFDQKATGDSESRKFNSNVVET